MTSNHNLEACFMRMVHRIKSNREENEGITVLIGAGCSLSSSEKDISTHGIIQSLVQEYSVNGGVPESWTALYKRFVNDVWEGQGESDRIQLLSNYFAGMTPSVGYQALRWLVENSYVNNIITTNFDPMIDLVMEGLSYRLVVAEDDVKIGNDPCFTLIKPHGDLEHGGLRFAPNELIKLPEKFEQEIAMLTSGTVLVVGYRGQDIGLLNALNQSAQHSVYWISRSCPDPINAYETAAIYTWMEKRNSKNNFLYGNDYGSFDVLLEKLKGTLSELDTNEQTKQLNVLAEVWRDSPIFDHFQLNKRFLGIFEQLHQQLMLLVQSNVWRITEPYHAESHKKLLQELIRLIQGNSLPDQELFCVGNEIDALLFSFSCSVRVLSLGYPYTTKELIQLVRQHYEADNNDVCIGSDFWNAADILSSVSPAEDSQEQEFDKPLIFYFDKDGNLQTILKRVDIEGMCCLLSNLLILLLFMRTSTEKSSRRISLSCKQTLESHLYQMLSHNGMIQLTMSPITREAYLEIYQSLLKPFFSQTETKNEYILWHDSIHIYFMIEGGAHTHKATVWETLAEQAAEGRQRFFQNFSSGQCIERQITEVLNEFIKSPSNGLFVTGDSGSGKTTLLQMWLSQLPSTEYLVYPIAGRDLGRDQEWNVGILEDERRTQNLETMLEQRDMMLLLIFDAINEIPRAYAEIVTFYDDLLELGEMLSSGDYAKIKLVISCRSDFYLQLKRSSGRKPSSRVFYTADTVNEPQSILELQPLNRLEISQFADLFRLDEKQVDLEKLIDEFGELIYLPANLRIICEAYETWDSLDRPPRKTDIYTNWFRALSSSAAKDSLSEDILCAVINKTIQYRFFDADDGYPQTHKLFDDLSGQYPNVLSAFEWLVVHRLFIKTEKNPNLIQFSHDSLEECFLGQYILTQYSGKLSSIDHFINDELQSNPIVKRGLRSAFLMLFQTDRLTVVNTFVAIIKERNSILLSTLSDVFLYFTRTDADNSISFAKELAQYLFQDEFNNFLQAVFLFTRQSLDDSGNISITTVDALGQIVAETNAVENPLLRVLAYYLKAKQRFMAPGENNTTAFRDSLELCKQADRLLTDTMPDSLVDELHTLQALLLQNQGYLNEAIELMSGCYKRQLQNAMYDLACQSALNLGAMYREMTQFDNAIELYDGTNETLVSDSLLRYRLLMNKGIIYKNKIQNALFEGRGDAAENSQYYQTALDNFKETCEYAEMSDDVKLRIEIYAERVELACVAYYLNTGTIRDAKEWIQKIDECIPRYRVPVARIQRHRMWARVLVLEREYEKAMGHLERGFTIAVDYNIPFRAADCCNQITGLICNTLDTKLFLTEEVLEKGLYYGQYAINYYEKLNQENHRYLQDARVKYDCILLARKQFPHIPS